MAGGCVSRWNSDDDVLIRPGATLMPIVRGIRMGCHRIRLDFGVFVVSMGLRNAGLTHQLGDVIAAAGGGVIGLAWATGLVAAVCSS